MNTRIHPTHRSTTQAGVALLALPAVAAGIASAAGYGDAFWTVVAFGLSATLLLPWIIWRNTRCRCPQCGAWLRINRDTGRSYGGPQMFRCSRCEIAWDDGMERGAG